MNAWDWIKGIASGPVGWANLAVQNTNKSPNKKHSSNWYGDIANWFGSGYDEASDSELARWFKDSYSSKITDQNVLDYINGLDEDTLGALIGKYYDDTGSDWFGTQYELNTDALLKDLNAMSNVHAGPSLESYLGNYVQEANDAIDKENADVLALYDQSLNRQSDAYRSEMNNLNKTYNDYAQTILSNDYNKNAQLMGTLQNNLNRSRQNALEAGANAGLQIASNVNTLLSAQNKQASTSLETSNQLAQAMMNQRNAAAGIRSSYNNMLTQDTQNRANLRAGSYERKLNAQNQLYNSRYNEYQTQDQINTERNGNYTSNPFYDTYLNHQKANNY